MKKWLFFALAGILIIAGCTTNPAYKDSPFYSTFYQRHPVPDPDRANTILTYYSYGTLYVPWGLPLLEYGPEYQAVRPFYSAYGKDVGRPVYNVLWPIGRFDPADKRYRIFPVYWGDDYFNVFPFYWHEGEPMAGTGHDALFPLWIWQKRGTGTSLHLAWPFYAQHNYQDWNAWRLWPLYGMKQTPSALNRYIAWPLFHSYTHSAESGHSLIPLYGYTENDQRTRFLSLPYSISLARQPGATSWDLALPLWHRNWEGEKNRWAFYPALSWGYNDPDRAGNRYLLGLAGYGYSPELLKHYAFPLYYYARDSESKAFYTLPWWRQERTDGSGFSALLPLYYHGYSDDYSSVYTLPWWKKSRTDGTGFSALIPLYYRSYSQDASSFYSLPWFSSQHVDGSGWHTSIPLYYSTHTTNSSAFYSLPWMSEQQVDGTSWKASFPFYYSATSPDGSIMITPLYARKLHDDGSTAWRCYIPLVYVNDDYDAHFMTLLGGRWRLGDRENWLALPLLSGGAKDADSGRNIYLGGLAGQRWDDQGTGHYVFPLYYRSPPSRSLVSLPYATWSDGDRQNHIIPPLLSGWYSDGDVSRGLLAMGVAGYRSGGDHPYHYLFPLYYKAPENGTFVSLPYSAWKKNYRRNHLILPLLSGWYSGDDRQGGVFAAGLAGYRRGGEHSFHYVFPLYYADPDNGSFLSLPYATWVTGDRQHHSIPLILSGWSTAPDSTDTQFLAGLGYWRQGVEQAEASHLIPFYAWSRNNYFYSLIYGKTQRKSYFATPLVGRYESGSGKAGSWTIPFYWHKRDISSDSVKGYWFPLGYYEKSDTASNHGFLGLYDYNHRTLSWERKTTEGKEELTSTESKNLHYLLFIGKSWEYWMYTSDLQEDTTRTLDLHTKNQSLFPLWSHQLEENQAEGSTLETSSLLGILYDTRHETGSAENEQHDYMRRRVLWRLYHYEKLNGEMSTDIFPGITVDSYKNGYYKFSVLWRVFRFEKDPETGDKKLDLLFLPLKR